MSGRGAFAVLVGVLAAAVVMFGCGGGGGSDTAVAESSIPKAQYVKKAESVCKKGEEELQADFASFVKEHEDVKKPSDADYAELFEKVVEPNISAEIDELRELEVPKGDASQVEAMLDAREESVSIAEGEPKVMVENSEKVFGKASKLADEYGLKGCATR
jgi:hypothetical protein